MQLTIQRLATRIHTAKRLSLLVSIVSLLLLVVAIMSALHLNRIQALSEEVHSRNVASIRAAVELEMHVQELRHQLDRYLLLRELNGFDSTEPPHLQTIASLRTRIDGWLLQAKASAHTSAELSAIEQVDDGLSKFYAAIEGIGGSAHTEDQTTIMVRRAEDILENEVLVPARRYLSIDEALLTETAAEAATQSHRLVLLLIYLGVFGAITAMIAGYGLARMISQSLFQLRIPMQDVAGKLSEVAGDVVVSARLDLADLGPVLERVATEVTAVVEQLHQKHQEILHGDQLACVGQLAAGIAHEIRNPLMSMKMLVQSARSQDSGSLDELDLRILDDEIRRLEVLLDEFLDFARPKPLQKAVVDLRYVAENVVSFLQPQADVRKIVIECDIPARPVLLSVDAPRIRQVILNLLLNGIQVTPPGGAVCLSFETPELTDGEWCQIQIRDSGAGIRPELADRVFEPFFSTKETGLGLGLAVSQRIVRSHGGELSLESANGRGATFVISLPVETLGSAIHDDQPVAQRQPEADAALNR